MAAPGPLVVSADNPRYFAQPNGTRILLQGSHTWTCFQELSLDNPATVFFDFDAYLDYVESAGATFIRGWMWGIPKRNKDSLFFSPLPWKRTGPGTAADGGLKFDLTSFDQDYFDQVCDRCAAAGERGIYISVMLFDGFSVNSTGVWDNNPFKSNNNINSINGDPCSTSLGFFSHTLGDSAITALQEAYVSKMIETVNGLDNVIYEISNEDASSSADWQAHFIDFIHSTEAGMDKQHPIWFSPPTYDTFPYSTLLASDAEAIGGAFSLSGGSWADDITENDGTKVNILDTDHIYGGLTASTSDVWAWKCFLRGNNVVHMDNMAGLGIIGSFTDALVDTVLAPFNAPMRRAMTQTGSYAARLDLRFAVPHGDLTSTAYCLGNPGSQYLTLAPSGGTLTVDLSAGLGKNFSVEWLKVSDGMMSLGSDVGGGSSSESFSSPFGNLASVLFLNERVPAEQCSL